MLDPLQSIDLAGIGEPAVGAPLYWRLGAVASLIGVAPETLLGDCEAGRVGIRIARFGARQLPYAHSGDTLDFIRNLAAQKKGPTT